MIRTASRLFAVLMLGSASVAAFALPVTPTYTTFANLPSATYGGSGIPTDPSAITTSGNLTLGLAATQRFVGPNLGNNGAGTYFANPGVSGGRATWNFDFYINDSQNSLASNGYTYKLLYDFNPGVGTDESALGVFDLTSFATGNTLQNSENSTFAFLLGGPSYPFISPPGGAFNPNAQGEYSFVLAAYDRAGSQVARSAILVDVGTVPEPASIALLGLGLAGLAFGRRKTRN